MNLFTNLKSGRRPEGEDIYIYIYISALNLNPDSDPFFPRNSNPSSTGGFATARFLSAPVSPFSTLSHLPSLFTLPLAGNHYSSLLFFFLLLRLHLNTIWARSLNVQEPAIKAQGLNLLSCCGPWC